METSVAQAFLLQIDEILALIKIQELNALACPLTLH
jgi:hypothetical protein